MKIFISYRRSDSQHQAGRIFDRLSIEFGSEHIFKDVDSIPFGEDFSDVIAKAMTKCEVLLALVGDRWLESCDAEGNRRLDKEDDFVRIEIESALKSDILVIPVLVGQSEMPAPSDLPATIRELSSRNAAKVRPDPDFASDIQRLVRQLHKAGKQGVTNATTPLGRLSVRAKSTVAPSVYRMAAKWTFLICCTMFLVAVLAYQISIMSKNESDLNKMVSRSIAADTSGVKQFSSLWQPPPGVNRDQYFDVIAIDAIVKYRKETRTRLVSLNGKNIEQSYVVQVPYIEKKTRSIGCSTWPRISKVLYEGVAKYQVEYTLQGKKRTDFVDQIDSINPHSHELESISPPDELIAAEPTEVAGAPRDAMDDLFGD